MREFLEIMLTQEGYQVTLAENGERAGSILDKQNFDLVITDIRMKDIDGIGVLRKAKAVSPNTMVVLISAFMKEGAYDYIPKPFKVREFKKIVKDALRSRKPDELKEDDYLKSRYHFGCLVGESPQMGKVYDLIKRVAQTRTNILISGESGTGKELVAKAIHQLSQRREK
ncbi:MAG: sigma-54-dependent Fis family transcriptional regulator, partial [Deltaproteobacteria bacterium]|nr:sigma-54-dependent Fis family transcriptional regulator [Deltaproteobacteria bacterium]